MRILTRQEQRQQQKKREAQTRAYNRRIAKEGVLTQAILEQEIDAVIARKQFIKDVKYMSKTASNAPKQFSKRTDAYTAWLITFGHRWVSSAEVREWRMWDVFEVLPYKYMKFDLNTGKAKLKTPEELDQ